MRRLLSALVAVPLVLALTACSDWLGDVEAPPLPGQRISVLALDTAIEPDPRVADLAVRLPRPYINREWPQPGGYPDRAMHHLAGAEVPRIAWRRSIGAGSDDDGRILSTPVMARGRVFAMDALGEVVALAADSGRPLWSFDPTPDDEDEGGFGGGLAHSAGRLFATTGYGEVIALDPETGDVVWRVRPGVPFRSGPVVADKRVFAISFDNRLWVFDGHDGQSLWSHAGITETAGLVGGASPAVAGDIVLVPYSSGEIAALRVENGRTIWSDVLGLQGTGAGGLATLNDINGSPVVDRGLAFAVSHGGRLVAIDMSSGSRVWEQDISGLNTPWIAGDFLFIVTTEGDVVCLLRDTGRIKWVQSLPRFEDPEDRDGPIDWSGPLLLSDRLILTSSAGVAIALSPYDGRYLGRMAMPSAVRLPPVVAGGAIYVLTDQAELVALR